VKKWCCGPCGALSHNTHLALPNPDRLGFFVLAALVLLLIPGPAVLYVVAQSLEQGRRTGLASVAGVHLGTCVHVLAAAVGLSALVVASAAAFTAVKLAGAAYLVYLGVRRLLDRRSWFDVERRRVGLRTAFVRGTVVNVLNPKTALFFLAFLPQFVDPDRTVWSQVLALGLLFVCLGAVTDSLYALVAGTFGRFLRRRQNALRWGSGFAYIGLGAAAAVAKRS
jgi:threonine/homoserine/homoserine lactone efflux protein